MNERYLIIHFRLYLAIKIEFSENYIGFVPGLESNE